MRNDAKNTLDLEIQSYRNQFIIKLDGISSSEIGRINLALDNNFTKESAHILAKTLRNSGSKLLLDINRCSHTLSSNGIN